MGSVKELKLTGDTIPGRVSIPRSLPRQRKVLRRDLVDYLGRIRKKVGLADNPPKVGTVEEEEVAHASLLTVDPSLRSDRKDLPGEDRHQHVGIPTTEDVHVSDLIGPTRISGTRTEKEV